MIEILSEAERDGVLQYAEAYGKTKAGFVRVKQANDKAIVAGEIESAG